MVIVQLALAWLAWVCPLLACSFILLGSMVADGTCCTLDHQGCARALVITVKTGLSGGDTSITLL
jgi:hypothetical protein